MKSEKDKQANNQYAKKINKLDLLITFNKRF